MLERKFKMNIQLFAEKQPEENDVDNLEDIDIAEQANKIIKDKDKEIYGLKKQIAQMKLLQDAPETVELPKERSAEEAMKDIYNEHSSNYDIMKGVLDVIKANEREGKGNSDIGTPEEVEKFVNFLEEVFEACDGDKSSFNAYYQAMLSEDEPKDRQAYLKAIKNIK